MNFLEMIVSELDYVDLPFQFRLFVQCKLQRCYMSVCLQFTAEFRLGTAA